MFFACSFVKSLRVELSSIVAFKIVYCKVEANTNCNLIIIYLFAKVISNLQSGSEMIVPNLRDGRVTIFIQDSTL